MNPKEFDWSESQQITVTNPNADVFIWQVHGKEYSLEAGQSASMPGYLAWIYVYNQACKKAQEDNMWNRWNEEEIRKEYYQKFVAGVQPIMKVVEIEKSPVEVLDDDTEGDVDPLKSGPRRGRPARVQ